MIKRLLNWRHDRRTTEINECAAARREMLERVRARSLEERVALVEDCMVDLALFPLYPAEVVYASGIDDEKTYT